MALDITPELNGCLKQKGAQLILKPEYDLGRINSFLQEAYSINARITDLTHELRSLRPAYLSTAAPNRRHQPHDRTRQQPLTDKEKDSIDASSKQLLRELNQAITQLQQTETLRTDAATQLALRKRAKTGLGRWAAGGAVTAPSPEEEREEAARRSIAESRESVIFYLQKQLETAGRTQAGMMEVRLGREVEKSKSVLYKSRMGGGVPYAASNEQDFTTENAQADDAQPQLTQDQKLLFEEENTALLRHYNTQLDQISTAEKSIREISELQSTLVTNIQMQSENISQLVQDSYLTTENLGRGNRELKRASERRSTAQTFFWATCGICGFLVAWDLVF